MRRAVAFTRAAGNRDATKSAPKKAERCGQAGGVPYAALIFPAAGVRAMSLSMYEVSIPVFIRGLTVLSSLLEKGQAHAAQTGAGEEMVQARLAPDMLTLAGQVQRASDT